MPKNEILPFGIADGANVLPADEYQKLNARKNGFNAGVARSQELNTVWRQSSMIAHVIAQFIVETNNSDVLDDGNIDKLKSGLISALSRNVNNTVPTATTTVAGITKLNSATNSDDETQAATPKAVKAAYDLAKTVSIDEINKKLDKSSVLQTLGDAVDKVLSQKACTDTFAKKISQEKVTFGQIEVKSDSSWASLILTKADGNKLLLETAPGDAQFVYRDAGGHNNTILSIPSAKNGTLALTSDVEAVNNFPVGAAIPWPHANPPIGYLVCGGQYFDKINYPKLALIYPSGRLPNLYGEFIRGLDLDGHVDPGRTALSNQGDAARKITGKWNGGVKNSQSSGSVNFHKDQIWKNGRLTTEDTNFNNGRGALEAWDAYELDSSLEVPTANENRPRNVAFLYIVRAA